MRTQIAVALIVYLLLRLAHAAQTAIESLLTFTRLVERQSHALQIDP